MSQILRKNCIVALCIDCILLHKTIAEYDLIALILLCARKICTLFP